MGQKYKKLTKAQKRLFVEQADNGFENVLADDYVGTELYELLSDYNDLFYKLEDLNSKFQEDIE